MTTMTTVELTLGERKQIAEILGRRANEIAGFLEKYRIHPGHHGSVAFALTCEVERLRRLAKKVRLPDLEEGEG